MPLCEICPAAIHLYAHIHVHVLYRGDFPIMFGENTNQSVFLLFEMACVQLCNVSRQSRLQSMKATPSGQLYDRFIYNTMVWGKLHYMVCRFTGGLYFSMRYDTLQPLCMYIYTLIKA